MLLPPLLLRRNKSISAAAFEFAPQTLGRILISRSLKSAKLCRPLGRRLSTTQSSGLFAPARSTARCWRKLELGRRRRRRQQVRGH